MTEVDLLLKLFNYNAWANERYRIELSSLSIEELKIETKYGNLLDRIVHIFASFEMWYDRIQGKSPVKQLSSKDFDSWDDLIDRWKKSDSIFIDYLENVEEGQLERTTTYISLDGKKYTRKVKDILLHLIQHPTYHRGQISAILKERGIIQVPGTDIVVFIKPEIN